MCCLQKGFTRLAATSDTFYQLLAYGRWVSPGPLASSITKTGRLDIAEILLKAALNYNRSDQINSNNNNIQNITRQSKTCVCLTKVTINMITLSVIIPCLFSVFVITVLFSDVVYAALDCLFLKNCPSRFFLTLIYIAISTLFVIRIFMFDKSCS
jgi:hypothetical protein